ncbi:GNAT family N-acetyltransferase [Robiginitomaculum antarcticum]|uniref:GNAT family N-acetyltransferase n=1 Tax=Robiginitomaculum antarcticum TaxID=437507 RepID=UPI00035FE416|nr:GNAT family N-acetyltransferase [Robiginitomaculum antarcticum]
MNDVTYNARIITDIAQVGQTAWNGLQPAPSSRDYHPFTDYQFLHALEQSGCAQPETGWSPCHIAIEDAGGILLAAAPLYAKSHSQGEYVFDHGWADALERAGLPYYPKFQCAVPFTPANGPRLIGNDINARRALISATVQLCGAQEASGVHATFLNDDDRALFDEAGFLMRQDRQFHFINQGFENFDDFLAALTSRKRKNLRKERAKAQDGVTIKRLRGDDLKPEHWDAFYQFYLDTSQRKWGRPYLNRAFFDLINQTFATQTLLVLAYEGGTPIAGALNFIGGDTLYGRHWGALVHKPFLHFELCYYQAIDAALELGLSRVEAGAQGEHKLARGYEPVVTHSAHYLAHPGLRDAVDNYLKRERRAVEYDAAVLANHTPFKADMT